MVNKLFGSTNVLPRHKRSNTTLNISRRAIRNGALIGAARSGVYNDNSVDAFNVQLWAMESLAILTENMVYGSLVHRDFSNEIAAYGNVVNTRKPSEFVAKRKTNNDQVTVQNANATNIPVKLDQQVHVSFLIRDGEESIAFQDLVAEFLRPAMIAQARFIDQIIAGQVYQFVGNRAGRLGAMDETNGKKFLLDTRTEMNTNKTPIAGRRLVLGTAAEATLLDIEQFTDAQRVGDDGTALREAALGRKLGFDLLMDQNTPYITAMSGLTAGAINLTGGYSPGATSFTVDGFSAAITVGRWFTIAGDDTPMRVVSTTGGATPTAIVGTDGIQRAVADNAVVTLCPKGTVSGTYSYDSATGMGYAKEITYANLSVTPQVGQGVSFGTSSTSAVYSIIQVNSGSSTIVLDRPIEASLADGDALNLMPAGGYNFAFTRNAVSLVSRPMVQPRTGTGAWSTVMNFGGIALRVTITYEGRDQGHLVTIDLLCGIKKLDDGLGAVMLS